MTDNELILEIIDNAQKLKYIEFHYITSWAEFRHYSKLITSTKFIIRALKSSANKLFDSYCKDVIAGISAVNKLLAYSQLQDIITFYKKDLDTLRKMVNEYDEYLGNLGNLIGALLGERRDI